MTKIVAQPSGANTATRLDLSGVTDDRRKDTTHVALGFDFKRGKLALAGGELFALARAPRRFSDNTVGESDLRLTRIGWTAERAGVIRRRGHSRRPPVRTGTTSPTTAAAISRRIISPVAESGKTEEYTARVDARYALGWKLPTFFKIGLSERVHDACPKGDCLLHRNLRERHQNGGGSECGPAETRPAGFGGEIPGRVAVGR